MMMSSLCEGFQNNSSKCNESKTHFIHLGVLKPMNRVTLAKNFPKTAFLKTRSKLTPCTVQSILQVLPQSSVRENMPFDHVYHPNLLTKHGTRCFDDLDVDVSPLAEEKPLLNNRTCLRNMRKEMKYITHQISLGKANIAQTIPARQVSMNIDPCHDTLQNFQTHGGESVDVRSQGLTTYCENLNQYVTMVTPATTNTMMKRVKSDTTADVNIDNRTKFVKTPKTKFKDLKDRYTPQTWNRLQKQHRDNERSRHQGLNNILKQMSSLVPGFMSSKETKIVMLRKVINYICFLEQCLEHLVKKLDLYLPEDINEILVHDNENPCVLAQTQLLPRKKLHSVSQSTNEEILEREVCELPFCRYKQSSPNINSGTDGSQSSISLHGSQNDPLNESLSAQYPFEINAETSFVCPMKASNWDPDQWQSLFKSSFIMEKDVVEWNSADTDEKMNEGFSEDVKHVKVEPFDDYELEVACSSIYEPMDFDVVHNISGSCCLSGRHDGIQDLQCVESSHNVDIKPDVAILDSKQSVVAPLSLQYQYYGVGEYIHQQQWKTTSRTRGIDPDKNNDGDGVTSLLDYEDESEKESFKSKKLDMRKTSWMNGFMMFSRIHRRDFIDENRGTPTAQISKLLGSSWRKMSFEEQEPYRLKAQIYSQCMRDDYLQHTQDQDIMNEQQDDSFPIVADKAMIVEHEDREGLDSSSDSRPFEIQIDASLQSQIDTALIQVDTFRQIDSIEII